MHRIRSDAGGAVPTGLMCAAVTLVLGAVALGLLSLGCANTTGPVEAKTRAELIPADAVKVTPATDVFRATNLKRGIVAIDIPSIDRTANDKLISSPGVIGAVAVRR